MVKVINISGKAMHGKDTTAQYLKEYLESHNKKVVIIHFADYLKFICRTYLGWNGEKDEAGRTLLQQIGTEKVRKQNPYFWVEQVRRLLDIFRDDWDYAIIPDTRFPDELFDVCYDALHIRVKRLGFESPLTKEQQNHPSECALDKYTPDICIQNRTLEQLKKDTYYVGKLILAHGTSLRGIRVEDGKVF